ncbi:MAG: efflux RND transporter periplasmic adaptor subunit [Bacteroidales bacterium]|nr:efflux RND transporter periplasmic adaptor subunit [Bacteroidales bacterium]
MNSVKITKGIFLFLLIGLYSCGQKANHQHTRAKELPVITLHKDSIVINKNYPARIEGKVNVDIRAQVEGYISKIYVEEGAYVRVGENLFKIDDRTYVEQLNTAEANLRAANAALSNAKLEVDKYSLLSEGNVTSDFQLRTAKAQYESASANVAQQKAAVQTARINIGFTLVKSPVSGYIGRIPKRIGNLISRGDTQPLTTLSDISQVYTYFSMSEKDFLAFNQQYQGKNMDEKIKNMARVSLILADGSTYPHAGKIELINGEFDTNTGAISIRAVFDNPGLLLRTGNTGRVTIPRIEQNVFAVPILSTMDMQGKIFVVRLKKDNTAERVSLNIADKEGDYYIVRSGLNDGDKIVSRELTTVVEGEVITPKAD